MSHLKTIRSVIDRVLWTAGAAEQNRALLAEAIAEELAANYQIGGVITDVAATPAVTVNKELLALLVESQDGIGGDWRARRDAAVSKAQAAPSEIGREK